MGSRTSSTAMTCCQPLHLLLLLVLAFSYVMVYSSAVPVTRSGGIMREIPRVDAHLLDQATNMMEEKRRSSVKGRMAVELDDYPGSGANNRHTPRAFSHGCSDC